MGSPAESAVPVSELVDGLPPELSPAARLRLPQAVRLRSALDSARIVYALPYLVLVSASWVAYGLVWHSPLVATTAWDGQHYLAIAAHGYPTHLATNYSNLAFFPGLPLAVAALHAFGPSLELSGFCISFLAGAVFVRTGAVLVELRYGSGAGRRASMLLAVCPGAFLFGISYADPLALALMATCLLALERGRFPRAALLGALAGLTSPAAVPVVLAGLGYMWRPSVNESGVAARATVREMRQKALIASCSMLLGPVAFMGYLWAHTGMFTAWFAAEGRGWGQGFDLAAPVQHIATAAPTSAIPATEIACALLAVAAMVAMGRLRVPPSWWLIAVPVVAIGLFARGSWLDPRILLDAFPLALATAVAVRGRWFVVLVVCSVVAMQLCLVAYTVMWGNIVAQP